MSTPFYANQFLRAIERVKHAELAKDLGALITALGYDEHTHQFLHAEKFRSAFGAYPSEFLIYIQRLLADGVIQGQASTISEDHLLAEALAILNLVTAAAMPYLQQSPLPTDHAIAIRLQRIADQVIAAWEQEKGKAFLLDDQVAEQFTLRQARAYLVEHAAAYAALPGRGVMIDGY